jgi:hypothetical protein
MAKIIAKNVVVRKPGFLYFVDKAGNVCEAEMSRKGRKTGSGKKKQPKKKAAMKAKK